MNVVEDTIESMLLRLDELGALFTVSKISINQADPNRINIK